MKDYYRTLGIIDDAEDIIIRAAYKALAQRYHPDKWSGDPIEANKKMAEINEAYEVLSDKLKKSQYDKSFFQFRAKNESVEENDKESNFISEKDEAWLFAIDFFPIINTEYLELQKISKILANTFKALLISSQEFNSSSIYKEKLLNEHLSRYYGENKVIQQFAKKLLLTNQSKAAIEVNKLVRYMGSSITEDKIISHIVKKYNIEVEGVTTLSGLKEYEEKIRNKKLSVEEIFYLLQLIYPNMKQEKNYYDGIFTIKVEGVNYSMDYYQILNLLSKKIVFT